MRVLPGLLLLIFLLAGCGETPELSRSPGSGAPEGTTVNSGVETTEEATETTSEPTRGPELYTLIIHTSGGEEVRVRVEIADSPIEITRGLMYRTALAEDRGMLFVYPYEARLSFWMKNTLIPLSIAFIDAEGRIVDIQDMKPLDDDPPSYVSAKPARYALEVNQGFFEERGVKVGDRVELSE